VLAVGHQTVAGIIQEAINEDDDGETKQTLLQRKLEIMAGKIGNIGIACAVLTIIASLIRILLESFNVLPCGCGNMFIC